MCGRKYNSSEINASFKIIIEVANESPREQEFLNGKNQRLQDFKSEFKHTAHAQSDIYVYMYIHVMGILNVKVPETSRENRMMGFAIHRLFTHR